MTPILPFPGGRWSIVLVAGACACASADMAKGASYDSGAEMATMGALRLDVLPSGNGDLLPQSFSVTGDNLNQISLQLSPTVTIRGTVLGQSPSPIDITVPSNVAYPVEGNVTFEIPGTVVHVSTTSNAAGEFSVDVPASIGYTVRAVAALPTNLPLSIEENLVFTTNGTHDVQLGLGTPVGGYLQQSDGTPPPDGFRVYLEDLDSGEHGAVVEPTADGAFLLRGLPGAYSLVVDGEPGSALPTLTLPIDIDATDTFVDLEVDIGTIETGRVNGTVLDTEGRRVEGAEVRFVSQDLFGIDEDSPTIVSTDTDRNGLFTRELPYGEWRMQVIPQFARDVDVSPVEMVVTIDTPSSDLPDLTLAPHVPLDLRVISGGNGAANIVVTAQEQGFLHYTYTATTDADGRATVSVPAVPLTLTLQPPDDSKPITRVSIEDPSQPHTVALGEAGTVVGGTLFAPSARPLTYALVEVRTETGLLLGTTLTDGSGNFDVMVGDVDTVSTDSGLAAREHTGQSRRP